MRCQQIWSAACRELPLPFKLGFAAGAATFGALCHTRKQPGVSNGAGGFAPHSNFRVPCCRAPAGLGVEAFQWPVMAGSRVLERVAYTTAHAGVELPAGPSVWLAVVFNDMEINRLKGLIAIILRRFGNLERTPKFSG